MPVSEEYLDYAVDQLGCIGEVAAKRMFGGVGLYRDGFFFGLISGDLLYFKVDEENRPDYEAAGSSVSAVRQIVFDGSTKFRRPRRC